MKNEIENIFKEKFDSFESAPSAGLFDALQAKRAKKKKRAIWLWSAAAIGLLLVTGALLLNNGNTGIDKHTATSHTNNKRTTTTVEEQSQEEVVLTDAKSATNIYDEEPQTKLSPNNHNQIRKDKTSQIKTATKPSSTPTSIDKVKTDISTTLPTKPIVKGNHDRIDLYNKIVEENKGTSLYKAKIFTKTDTKEVDIIKKENLDKVVNNKNSDNAQNEKNDIGNDDTNTLPVEEQPDTNTSTPIHKLVKYNRWSIEALAGPGYAFSNRTSALETPQVSYAYGLNAIFRINATWNAHFGLYGFHRNASFKYSSKPYEVISEKEETRYETIIHPVLGEIEREYTVTVNDTTSYSAVQTTSDNQFVHITVPLTLEKQFWQNDNWTLLAKGGILMGIISSARGITLANGELIHYDEEMYKSVGLRYATIGMGAGYRISDRVKLMIYPQATLQLNSSVNAFTQKDVGIFTQFGLRVNL